MTSRLLRTGWHARSGAFAVLGSSVLLRRDRLLDSPTNWPQSRSASNQSNNATTPHDRSKTHPAADKRGDARVTQPQRSPDDEASAGFEDDDETAWGSFSRKINASITSFNAIEWNDVGESITDYIVPMWARQMPTLFQKLQRELSMAPGSLADDIWKEAHDVDINPEIMWDASVRISDDLPEEEKHFRAKRKQKVVKALAKYLDIPEKDIHPDDVPTIAMCGSGGGLRALVAGAGSALSAQEAGLLDCVTYTAGVSGSCWLQTLYHSSMAGRDYQKLVNHLKKRLDTHIAYPPTALELLTAAPTNKLLLSGIVEKMKADPTADFGLVDAYGLLLGARLLVPKGELAVSDRDFKMSNQRYNIDDGSDPMPIYTAVRHEIPVLEAALDSNVPHGSEMDKDDVKSKAKKEAWFQWFEWTPYEFFCEEIGAGIPTWALGRKFENGRNVLEDGYGTPEIRVPVLMGIWGSAFCATLAHYIKEVRPLMLGIAGFGTIDALIQERNEDLIKVHPFDPAKIPNFVLGLKDKLPSSCPESLFRNTHLDLLDAGVSSNLPIYPLLRPGRDVDIMVVFDASADVKEDNWLSVVDGYARQRGIKAWPVGAGWPKPGSKPEENVAALENSDPKSPEEADAKLADAVNQGKDKSTSIDKSGSSEIHDDLGYCTVWVGTTEERTSDTEPPPSKRLDFADFNKKSSSSEKNPSSEDPNSPTFHLMQPHAGTAVVYFPFLANESKVPGVDPRTSEYMSTWNFVYKAEEIDDVVRLARANFEEGKEQTRETVRAVYERKKRVRLEREGRWKNRELSKRIRKDGDHFQS